MSTRRASRAWIAAVCVGLAACSSSKDGKVDEHGAPPAERFDIGSGGPDAIARRSARELADSAVLAARSPRVGALDQRYTVRFVRTTPMRSTGTLCAFESLFENALVGSGDFLLVDDLTAPTVTARVSGELGSEMSCVLVRGPADELWVELHGHLDPSN